MSDEMKIKAKVFEDLDTRPIGATINFSFDDRPFSSDIIVQALVFGEDLRRLWGELGDILKVIDKAANDFPDG